MLPVLGGQQWGWVAFNSPDGPMQVQGAGLNGPLVLARRAALVFTAASLSHSLFLALEIHLKEEPVHNTV